MGYNASATPSFGEIYYFGDSLTDTGGFNALSQPLAPLIGSTLPPAALGYAGQFSNGAVYSELTAERLGVEDASVFNFAIGGARAIGVQPYGPFIGLPDGAVALLPSELQPAAQAAFDTDINITGQLQRFLTQVATQPPAPDSAASVLIGLNDLGGFVADLPNIPPEQVSAAAEAVVVGVINANLTAIATLQSAGVGTVIFNTLPSGDFFPTGAALPPGLPFTPDDIADAINTGIVAGAQALGLGDKMLVVDLNALTEEIQDDIGTFGFQTLDAFWFGTGGEAMLNPALADIPLDQIGFFDLVHPTTQLHGVWAAFSSATLGDTLIKKGDGADFVLGGRGEQTIFSNGGNDKVLAGKGDDLVFTGADNDRAFGQKGDDILFLGTGDDTGLGGSGDDIVAGGSGNDAVFGGSGNDAVAGGAGDDLVSGGAGRDVLTDGLGDDLVLGGSGSDLFVYREASVVGGVGGDKDRFVGGSGYDTLVISVGADSAIDQEAFEASFRPGRFYDFGAEVGLKISGIERVIFVDGTGPNSLDITSAVDGAEFDRIRDVIEDADLWGLI